MPGQLPQEEMRVAQTPEAAVEKLAGQEPGRQREISAHRIRNRQAPGRNGCVSILVPFLLIKNRTPFYKAFYFRQTIGDFFGFRPIRSFPFNATPLTCDFELKQTLCEKRNTRWY